MISNVRSYVRIEAKGNTCLRIMCIENWIQTHCRLYAKRLLYLGLIPELQTTSDEQIGGNGRIIGFELALTLDLGSHAKK